MTKICEGCRSRLVVRLRHRGRSVCQLRLCNELLHRLYEGPVSQAAAWTSWSTQPQGKSILTSGRSFAIDQDNPPSLASWFAAQPNVERGYTLLGPCFFQ